MRTFEECQAEERAYQRKHWLNDEHHSPWEWAALLARYVGRVAESACHGFKPEAFKEALVKIAAVAQAAYEAEVERDGD